MSIPKWTGHVVGKMHNNKITVAALAKKMDINPKYVSSILNGNKKPKGARERFEAAVEEIIKERDSV